MEEPATIQVAALVGGAFAHLVRLPPLVGSLIAGFAFNALGVDKPVASTWSPTWALRSCSSASGSSSTYAHWHAARYG